MNYIVWSSVVLLYLLKIYFYKNDSTVKICPFLTCTAFYTNMLHSVITCFVLYSCVDGTAIHWLWTDLHHRCLHHLLPLQPGFSLHPATRGPARYQVTTVIRHTQTNVSFSNAANSICVHFQKKMTMKQRSQYCHITESKEWSPSKLDRSHKVKIWRVLIVLWSSLKNETARQHKMNWKFNILLFHPVCLILEQVIMAQNAEAKSIILSSPNNKATINFPSKWWYKYGKGHISQLLHIAIIKSE